MAFHIAVPLQPTPARPIDALTTTRAVAAIMVFIHHYGGGIYPFTLSQHLFHSGNLAVSYFFVLSGFVLYIAHYKKPLHYPTYLTRRAGRILPLYYAALLLTVGYYFCLVQPVPADLSTQIGYSVLLLQSWVPRFPMCLNGPAWSVAIEVVFYLIFPALLLWQRKQKWAFYSAMVVLFGVSQYLHLRYFPQRFALSDDIVDPVFFNPLIHISQFLIGMAGGYLYEKITVEKNAAKIASVLVSGLIVVAIKLRPEQISYHVGLLAPLFMILIIAVAKGNSRVLRWKGLVFLGEISYGIYILQYPIYHYAEYANIHWWHVPDAPFFWLALAVLLFAAAIAHFIIEIPFRKWITGS